MSRGRGRAPVVVGVDVAGSSGGAVDWAGAEAAARGCPLRVVHAFHPPLPADPYGVVPPIDDLFAARTAAEAILADAVVRARSVASDVEVSSQLLLGPAAGALLDEAHRACVLVLGTRGLRGLRGLLARSVSLKAAAHASCPVVVVPPLRDERDPGWSPARVVVGVGATSSCTTSAVGFAFRAARQRGVPLVAVHAWTPDPAADLEGICGPPTMAEALARSTLGRALDGWRSEFTDVSVHAALVRGAAAPALVCQSRGAALLVVGTRGRGHLSGAMRGSVGQAVLHHGSCPVAIIHPDDLRTAQPPAAPERDQAPEHDNSSGRRSRPRNRRWSG
jgi:nucleotide-binding universal stress UspA family protein